MGWEDGGTSEESEEAVALETAGEDWEEEEEVTDELEGTGVVEAV